MACRRRGGEHLGLWRRSALVTGGLCAVSLVIVKMVRGAWCMVRGAGSACERSMSSLRWSISKNSMRSGARCSCTWVRVRVRVRNRVRDS